MSLSRTVAPYSPARTPPASRRSGVTGRIWPFHTGYQRDRGAQPPAAQGGQDQRQLPQRGRRPETDLPRDHQRRAAVDPLPELDDSAAGGSRSTSVIGFLTLQTDCHTFTATGVTVTIIQEPAYAENRTPSAPQTAVTVIVFGAWAVTSETSRAAVVGTVARCARLRFPCARGGAR